MFGTNAPSIASQARDISGQVHTLTVAGTVLSLLGFVTPWFRWSDDSEWWYNGWEMVSSEGVSWIWFVFAGYLALLITSIVLPPRGALGAGVVAVLTVVVALATMVVVSLATADALNDIRTMDRPVWSVGMIGMLLGHAAMIFGSFACWVIAVLRSLLIPADEEN